MKNSCDHFHRRKYKLASASQGRTRIRIKFISSAGMLVLFGLLSVNVTVVRPSAIRMAGPAPNRSLSTRGRSSHATPPADLLKREARNRLAEATIALEPNLGQTDPRVKFLARADGYNLFLTSTGALLDMKIGQASADRLPVNARENSTHRSIEMEILGATAGTRLEPLEQLPSRVNYFIGRDPAKWHVDVPTYGRVSRKNVYPGVDLSYYGTQRKLEYDFVVAPGASSRVIRLGFKGAASSYVDSSGDLELRFAGGVLKQKKPLAYQDIAGSRREVPAQYVLLGRNEVGFQIGTYDPSLPLVIDPILVYSTYLGGTSSDEVFGVATNSTSLFVSGTTQSVSAFPVTAGAYQTAYGGVSDAFVARLDLSSSPSFTYITYLGGTGNDQGFGVAADEDNNAYITGVTSGGSFPTTPGSFRSSPLPEPRYIDSFVTKLNASGSAMVYSTYIGGGLGYDFLRDIDVDASGSAYVTGNTTSVDFPLDEAGTVRTTPGGLPHHFVNEFDQPDAVVLGLNAAGSNLIYTTFLGGPERGDRDAGFGIATRLGNQFVTGITTSRTGFPLANAYQFSGRGLGDAFVTRLEFLDGQLFLRYSTYLGGLNPDQGNDIAVDATGKAYVIGSTNSADFPLRNPLQPIFRGGTCGTSSRFVCNDVFVVKLDPYLAGDSSFLFGSYLGGRQDDLGNGIAVDSANDIYLTGETTSDDFPIRGLIPPDNSPLRSDYRGDGDVFITKLSPTGDGYDFIYSAYLGEIFDALTHQELSREFGNRVAVDGLANAYVVGQTSSNRFARGSVPFPTYRGRGDGFVAKVDETPLDRLRLIGLMLEAVIQKAGLPADQAKELLVKWDVLIKQVDKGNIKPAINQIEQFIAGLDALIKSGALTSTDAKILLAQADEIRDQLRDLESGKKSPR